MSVVPDQEPGKSRKWSVGSRTGGGETLRRIGTGAITHLDRRFGGCRELLTLTGEVSTPAYDVYHIRFGTSPPRYK